MLIFLSSSVLRVASFRAACYMERLLSALCMLWPCAMRHMNRLLRVMCTVVHQDHASSYGGKKSLLFFLTLSQARFRIYCSLVFAHYCLPKFAWSIEKYCAFGNLEFARKFDDWMPLAFPLTVGLLLFLGITFLPGLWRYVRDPLPYHQCPQTHILNFTSFPS